MNDASMLMLKNLTTLMADAEKRGDLVFVVTVPVSRGLLADAATLDASDRKALVELIVSDSGDSLRERLTERLAPPTVSYSSQEAMREGLTTVDESGTPTKPAAGLSENLGVLPGGYFARRLAKHQRVWGGEEPRHYTARQARFIDEAVAARTPLPYAPLPLDD